MAARRYGCIRFQAVTCRRNGFRPDRGPESEENPVYLQYFVVGFSQLDSAFFVI